MEIEMSLCGASVFKTTSSESTCLTNKKSLTQCTRPCSQETHCLQPFKISKYIEYVSHRQILIHIYIYFMAYIQLPVISLPEFSLLMLFI